MNLDCWDPHQYEKFEQERNQPFYDLLGLIHPQKNMSVVDLGHGTGKLTRVLHEKLQASSTLGIDASPEMMKKAQEHEIPHLQFQHCLIEDFINNPQNRKKLHLAFSNAALQWIPNHQQLFTALADLILPQGQLAIQMPSNFDFPTHTIAVELACQSPFHQYLQNTVSPGVLKIEDYSRLIHQLGFSEQHVRLQVYPHFLNTTDAIFHWVQGAYFTYYQKHLPPDIYQEFCHQYKDKLQSMLGTGPHFIPFKRILIWAKR